MYRLLLATVKKMAYDAGHTNLYVVDGNRVVVYSLATTTNGMNASYVIGQTGFTQNVSSSFGVVFSTIKFMPSLTAAF